MKYLLAILFFVSCSFNDPKPAPAPTPTPAPDPAPVSKYLTLEQIEKILDDYEGKPTQQENLFNAEANERARNLPKANEILDGVKLLKAEPVENNFRASNESFDYREHDQAIVNQWNGTCTAHATTAAMEEALSMQKGIKIKLSERDLWSKPEVFKKYSAAGAIQGGLKNFIVPDKYWKHSSEQPNYANYQQYAYAKINKAYYLGKSYVNLYTRMATKESGKIAMNVPNSMINCVKVINPASAPLEDAGHDIAISGFFNSQKYGLIAIIKNSWGENCGDHGYQYLPMSVCDREDYWCYFWSINAMETK